SLLVVPLLFLSVINAWAQTPIFKEKLNFPKDQITVYELANLLKQQAGISVSFDAKELKSNTKVKLPKRNMSIQELAVILTKQYNIKSKFIGRHIIIKRGKIVEATKPKSTRAKPKKTKKLKKEKAKEPELLAPQQPIFQEPTLAIKDVTNEKEAIENTVYFTDTFTMSGAAVATYGFSVGAESAEMSFDKHFDRLDDPEVVNLNPYWY